MSTIIHWLIFGLPWWVQTAIMAVPIILGFYVAVRVFGWERVRGFIVPALVALGAASALSRAQQKGYQAKTDEDKKNADDAIDVADKARREQERKDADPDHVYDDDGFRRD